MTFLQKDLAAEWYKMSILQDTVDIWMNVAWCDKPNMQIVLWNVKLETANYHKDHIMEFLTEYSLQNCLLDAIPDLKYIVIQASCRELVLLANYWLILTFTTVRWRSHFLNEWYLAVSERGTEKLVKQYQTFVGGHCTWWPVNWRCCVPRAFQQNK